MYIPKHFEPESAGELRALLRAHPLATLITLGSSGLDANPVPLLYVEREGSILLQGHVARANPVWRQTRDGSEALAVFNGPDAYVSPSWYPSKQENGRVVPTWNYMTVHARGTIRVIDDSGWLHEFLKSLTREHEARQTKPWAIEDAPSEYIEAMLRNVVGVEIAVIELRGKWKLSQNHSDANRLGVIEGLRERGTASDAALAALMQSQL